MPVEFMPGVKHRPVVSFMPIMSCVPVVVFMPAVELVPAVNYVPDVYYFPALHCVPVVNVRHTSVCDTAECQLIDFGQVLSPFSRNLSPFGMDSRC